MIDLLFPYSYVAIAFGALVGIGLTTAAIGSMSLLVVSCLIYLGMIHITPLINLFTNILNTFVPKEIESIKKNIKESFKVRFTELIPEGHYIYSWHPHGVVSMSHHFHIITNYTEWPKTLGTIRCVVLAALLWLPFSQEIFDNISAIPSEYNVMKQTLHNKESISVALGGMREMLGDSYLVKKRRGIFKMALETGTPIVPVLSFGENRLFSIYEIDPAIQKWVEQYDICICIPTLKSISKWLGMLKSPLKDPIESVVGSPIPVEQIVNPTEKDINQLRERYIEALRALFIKENPNKNEVFSVV